MRFGAERAVVRAQVVRDDRATLVEVEINPGRANRARINRSPVPRPREVLGLLRTVLFAPEDLALVKGDPSERRRFLDELLVARAPRMAGVRADYDRVLKQRNALLKSASAARRGGSRCRTTYFGPSRCGTRTSSTVGAELLAARLDLVAALDAAGRQGLRHRAARAPGPASLEYVSSLGPDVELAADRGAARPRLCSPRSSGAGARSSTAGSPSSARTATTSCCGSGAAPAKGYASHGESWSYALALRLASYDLLRSDGSPGGEPVLVLDDVFAELDVARRARLADAGRPAPSRCWSPRRSRRTCPTLLAGDRVDGQRRRGVACLD